MIVLKFGELYGMNSEQELIKTIEEMRKIGMSDEDIQKVLINSKKGESKNENNN